MKTVIARLRKAGQNFEIYVNLENAIKFRNGEIKDIDKVLEIKEIFRDAKKGERVSLELLKKAFGTTDIYSIAKEIIIKGEIQITTEYRRKIIEEKRKQIIENIRRLAIDPRTNAPFTYNRIEAMLKEIKYGIDPFKPVEKQVEEIIKELKKRFSIKIEIKKYMVKVPMNKLRVASILRKKYNLVREKYEDKWIGVFEVPAGISTEFLADISRFGEDIEVKEIK
jgi:ribosome maturation protein SDO1